jgi:hypothetical protein
VISVSIITREYPNQRVDGNSLYKIMVKVILHLNVSVPLHPNSSSASPGLVPIVRPGSGALTTRGPSWSGDGVAMATCDEPAASGVARPSVSLRRPVSLCRPLGSLRRPGLLHRPPGSLRPVAVSAESKLVVPVSTVMRQPPWPAAGHPWSRECRRTQTHPIPGSPQWSCRK